MPEVFHAAAAAATLAGLEVDVVHDHTLAGPLLPDAWGELHLSGMPIGEKRVDLHAG